jgi:hypothetical protein
MRPEEAKEYGIIDDIIQRHEKADEIHQLVQQRGRLRPGKDALRPLACSPTHTVRLESGPRS